MPTARIITQNRESASPVAMELQSRGYMVEIVSPAEVPAYSVDLEIDMGRYAAGAMGSLITSSEDVHFAHDQAAPSSGHLDETSQNVCSEGSDFYGEEFPVEREFVLAPLWRAFCSRFEGLHQIFRSHAPDKAVEPQSLAPEPCLPSTQQSEAVVDVVSVESVAEIGAAPGEFAPIASQEPEGLLPIEASSIEDPVARAEVVDGAGIELEQTDHVSAQEFAVDSSVAEEAQAISPMAEPVLESHSENSELADAVANLPEVADMRTESSEAAEHITFQPPSRTPKDPALVAAALRLEALLESSRSKASDLWVLWKDLDWSWVERGRRAVSTGTQQALRNARSQLAKFARSADDSRAEMQERLARPRERTLAYSFVLAAILAGFFLLGWIAAMRLNPSHIQAEPLPPQIQPASKAEMPAVMPEAAGVPAAPAHQNRAATRAQGASPAARAKHTYRASVADEDYADDVVIRHFGQKPKSVNNTASVKHYSDLEDQ